MLNGHNWAEDATLLPGWKRLGNAAVHAVSNPYTWLPASGAVALQFVHMDKNLSDWDIDHSLVFRSRMQGRVEGGVHYPSDVLAGLVLGHFAGVFFQDAFLGIDAEESGFEVAPVDGGFMFTLIWRF